MRVLNHAPRRRCADKTLSKAPPDRRIEESMGKVVKLEGGGSQRPTSSREPGARRRPSRSRSALVLGGGGITGGVYEIGALRALDLLSVNRTVNEFDVYVGTSAGSFVAAAFSTGVTPQE